MAGNSSVSMSLFPEASANFANVSRDKVLNYYNGFRSSLSDVVGMLTDPEADLQIGSYLISADNKNGTAATYALNEWMSEQEFIFSQLLDAYKFQQTLENKVNNFSFS